LLNSPVAVRVPTAPIASVSAAKGRTIFNASRWLKRGMMTRMYRREGRGACAGLSSRFASEEGLRARVQPDLVLGKVLGQAAPIGGEDVVELDEVAQLLGLAEGGGCQQHAAEGRRAARAIGAGLAEH